MATFNGVKLHVERESMGHTVNVPEHPVEEGIPLSDHVERGSMTLSLSGKILGEPNEIESVLNSLMTMQQEGKVGTYSGRGIYYNMAVVTLSIDTDANIANGHNFTMELKEIRRAGFSYSASNPSARKESSTGLKQTQNKNTAQQTHTIKKGDTYWDLADKYGTTWQQLYEWNKLDPRELPVGQKIRVK